MESRNTYHADAFIGFMNLGHVPNRLAACKTNLRLRLFNKELNCWRQCRNAIHEVMKIDAHYIIPWPARLDQLHESAVAAGRIHFAPLWRC